MQDGLDLIDGAGGASGHGAPARDEAVPVLRQRDGDADPDVRRPARRRCTCRTARDMQAGDARVSARRRSSGTPSTYFARYSWPVEFVVRAMKDIGWTGFSVGTRADAAVNMGQELFEPPDVAGWDARRRRGSRPARCWRA